MAAPLQDPDVQTPVFVRFSTVAGSRGSTDTPRDVRGFAVKFYTPDGVWDLVGNNMPVFFIQDANMPAGKARGDVPGSRARERRLEQPLDEGARGQDGEPEPPAAAGVRGQREQDEACRQQHAPRPSGVHGVGDPVGSSPASRPAWPRGARPRPARRLAATTVSTARTARAARQVARQRLRECVVESGPLPASPA